MDDKTRKVISLGVSWEDVKAEPCADWDWDCLTMNKNIPFKTIMENKDFYPWNMELLPYKKWNEFIDSEWFSYLPQFLDGTKI